jgi:hypothetical protein
MIPLLNKMRSLPGMYLGTPSLLRLSMFLQGYELAAAQLANRDPDPFLSDFRDWIHERYRSTTVPWEELILRESSDEADALQRFWRLFDEFVARRPKISPVDGAAVARGPQSAAKS